MTDYMNLAANNTTFSINSNLSAANFKAKQEEYQNQTAGFKTAVSNLQTRSQTLTGTASVLNKKYVSDSTGAVSGEAKTAAKPATYDVSVEKVATAQQNQGKTLTSTGLGGISAGVYTMGLTVGSGAEKQITVNISGTDTNKQALTKIADAVNRSGSSVKAEVKTVNDKTYLAMEGQTGASSSFSVRDIYGSLASQTSLTNQVKQAQDASYTVNGVSQKSASNAIKIDNGNVNLTLKSTTVGAEKVTVGPDANKTISAVRDLAATYNEINYNIQNSENVTKRGETMLKGIQSQFDGIRRSQYEKIGITMDRKTGNLAVDTETLTKALKTDAANVDRLISGPNGLATTAGKIAKTAQSTPTSAYFQAPTMSNYLQTNNNTNYYNYSQSLFLDMML
ncbi:MAG: flagellar filament capping protein FliD [Sporomusaceae bacterium]|nr:flagellar filament capping protein FliD [Sporomusaceae bacterium]